VAKHLSGNALQVGKELGMDYPLFQALREGLSPMCSAMGLRRTWRVRVCVEPPVALEVSCEYVNAGSFRTFSGLEALARAALRRPASRWLTVASQRRDRFDPLRPPGRNPRRPGGRAQHGDERQRQ
jgi:hypothetical protein